MAATKKISLGLAVVLLALANTGVADAQFINFAVQPLGRLTCIATFVPNILRAENLSARVGDSRLDCTNDGVYNPNVPPVQQNLVQYIQMNVNLTLNTAVTNGLVDDDPVDNHTDAIMTVNDNNSFEALDTSELAGPGEPCGPLFGTSPFNLPDIRYPCPHEGLLTGPSTLTWNGIQFPVPGAANCWPSTAQCVGPVAPTLPSTLAIDGTPLCDDFFNQTSSESCFDLTSTARFTNVRGNAAALGAGGTIIATLGVTAFASISVQTNQGAVGIILTGLIVTYDDGITGLQCEDFWGTFNVHL